MNRNGKRLLRYLASSGRREHAARFVIEDSTNERSRSKIRNVTLISTLNLHGNRRPLASFAIRNVGLYEAGSWALSRNHQHLSVDMIKSRLVGEVSNPSLANRVYHWLSFLGQLKHSCQIAANSSNDGSAVGRSLKLSAKNFGFRSRSFRTKVA